MTGPLRRGDPEPSSGVAESPQKAECPLAGRATTRTPLGGVAGHPPPGRPRLLCQYDRGPVFEVAEAPCTRSPSIGVSRPGAPPPKPSRGPSRLRCADRTGERCRSDEVPSTPLSRFPVPLRRGDRHLPSGVANNLPSGWRSPLRRGTKAKTPSPGPRCRGDQRPCVGCPGNVAGSLNRGGVTGRPPPPHPLWDFCPTPPLVCRDVSR